MQESISEKLFSWSLPAGFHKLEDVADPAALEKERRAQLKKEIIENRGAFKWLPVLCSNDLVHGSWWFVWGSVGATIFAVIPLTMSEHAKITQENLSAIDFRLTWGLLIFSGCFFTVGSLIFVRAFETPPRRPLLYQYKHFQTDELLAAWIFLIGTIPAVPYTLVYFLIDPTATYLGALSSSGVMVIGTLCFVLACYPSDKSHEDFLLPFVLNRLGDRFLERHESMHKWILKHLANDWLAGTWFFLFANGMMTIGSFGLLGIAVIHGSPKEIFTWVSSTTNSVLFFIGSLYYVSGSYPHADQFYYAEGRARSATQSRQSFINVPDRDNAENGTTRRRQSSFALTHAMTDSTDNSGGNAENASRRRQNSFSLFQSNPSDGKANRGNQKKGWVANSRQEDVVNPLAMQGTLSDESRSNSITSKAEKPKPPPPPMTKAPSLSTVFGDVEDIDEDTVVVNSGDIEASDDRGADFTQKFQSQPQASKTEKQEAMRRHITQRMNSIAEAEEERDPSTPPATPRTSANKI